jgi:hypothetical protein
MSRGYRRRLFSHPHRRPRTGPRPCPSWCDRDHAVNLDRENVRIHEADISRQVNILSSEDLETGETTGPEITVRAIECTSSAMARELALEILAAADLLEGGAR